MTNEQANELREFLIFALHRYGFGDVANEINDQVRENFIQEDSSGSSKEILLFFLSEAIEVFHSFSNKNYQGLISRFNRYVDGDIEGIIVASSIGEKESFYDLKELPDYSEISGLFEQILGDISNDKNTDDDTNRN